MLSSSFERHGVGTACERVEFMDGDNSRLIAVLLVAKDLPSWGRFGQVLGQRTQHCQWHEQERSHDQDCREQYRPEHPGINSKCARGFRRVLLRGQ
jgi:hypothetical protein